MKQIYLFFILFFVFNSAFASSQTSITQSFAQYGIYDTDGMKPQKYQQRRAAVMALMDSSSIAIFHANNLLNRNLEINDKAEYE